MSDLPAIITREDEGQFGPCMRALPERQRAFVVALLETGGRNHTRAALMAGYKDSPNAPWIAHRVFHDDKVQAAIHEETARRLNGAKVLAISILLELAEKSADEKIQLKAALAIANRVGFHETSEHKITVERKLDDGAMIERIKALAAKMGLDAQKLLGNAAPVDAEFEEVHDATGLEDLL